MLTKEQLELRRQGIGSSEIAALTGHSPWLSPWDVYRSKTSDNYEPEKTFKMRLGELFEPAIITLASERLGRRIIPGKTIKHPALPLVDTPDGMVEGEPAAVEVKMCDPWAAAEFGADGTDEVKSSYLLQGQWHMGLNHVRLCYMPVLFGTQELRIFRLEFDEALFSNAVDVAVDFWRKHVEPRIPPPIDHTLACSVGLAEQFPLNRGPLKDADEEFASLVGTYRGILNDFGRAKRLQDEFKNRIRDSIGDAEGIQGNGFVATWRADKRGKRSLRIKFDGMEDANE